jgi:hypothetical protein
VPSYEEAAVVVLGILHLAPHRVPVHMNVGYRHKYRYLQHLAIYVLLLVYNLGYDNTTITR